MRRPWKVVPQGSGFVAFLVLALFDQLRLGLIGDQTLGLLQAFLVFLFLNLGLQRDFQQTYLYALENTVDVKTNANAINEYLTSFLEEAQ